MLNIVDKTGYQQSTHNTVLTQFKKPHWVKINELLLIMWCNLILSA